MSKYIEVVAIVEGKTEQIFIEEIVAPYLGYKNIGMTATQVSKPGQKGGDVRFERVKKDLMLHLRQRANTFVTTFVDYYGIKEWPGLDRVQQGARPHEIAETINGITKSEMAKLITDQRTLKRFIPFIAIHEFEGFLFSDSSILASELGISVDLVDAVITECGQPEAINNSPETAPSKRLDKWSRNDKFPKTTMGIAIARKIGIEKIREKCQLFNTWIETFEHLQQNSE